MGVEVEVVDGLVDCCCSLSITASLSTVEMAEG